MTTLEILLTAILSLVFLWGAWCWYNWDKWMREYIKTSDRFLELAREHLKLQIKLADTKAELEQYKNHNDNA